MKVEVRPSSKHGNGVFAKKNIKKGTRLCYYDGEVTSAEEINKGKNIDYLLRHNNQYILGYKTPRTNDGIAQLINDGDYPLASGVQNYLTMLEIYKKYSAMSLALQNVYIDHKLQAIASRDIKEDEELYFSYGENYWMMNELGNSDNSFTRLILFHILFKLDKEKLTDQRAEEIMNGVMGQPNDAPFWKVLRVEDSTPREKLLCAMHFAVI
jgi:SET domain-containing protein